MRRRIKSWSSDSEHAVFVSGYIAALLDIERTGLKPKTERTRRECAERAWKRQGTDTPPATD